MDATAAAAPLTSTHREPKLSLLGSSAVLFEAPGEIDLPMQQRIWSLAETALGWDGIREAQPGITNLLVIFDPARRHPDELIPALTRAWDAAKPMPLRGKVLEVPVIYGGERGHDLPRVAEHVGMTPEEVVRLHAAGDYVVFAPGVPGGFGYLAGLDPRLFVPRRQEPVMREIGGTVAVAGLQCNLGGPAPPGPRAYSPTGWNTIGIAPVVPNPFDLTRDPVSYLALGDIVRFRIDRIET